MRATFTSLAAIVGLALTAATADAQQYFPCRPYYLPPQAPDACGPGFWAANEYGAPYGPNHWLRPPFPPFQGMVCPPGNGNGNGNGGPFGPQGVPAFPTHPYARSPRDFFMYYDK